MNLDSRQNLAMRKISILIGLTGALTSSALAQDHGLDNSSRKFTKAAEMSANDWSDPLEMERSWQAAVVRVPSGNGRSRRMTTSQVQDQPTGSGTKLPTVIFMHGCSGFWSGSHRRIEFLANNGFLVIAPASFARNKYPLSCDTDTHKGGLYRGTLRMRQHDAGYAIEMARKLPIVDGQKIFLMGFSQGGVTTATFAPRNEQQHVRARIVEGWTCHAGWNEYRGVNARRSEPVLTLVAKLDPWFQNEWTRGNCSSFLDKTNGSKSIVYSGETMMHRHALLELESVQETVLSFMREHLE